jgi:chromosome segregation ATPase
MARRRDSTLELNFDSLTDTITNLCGGLILLVMLVTGASQPKKEGVTELPPPENKVGSDSRVDQLLNDLHTINAHVEQVEQDTARVEARLPEIEEEIEELSRQFLEKAAKTSS